MRRSKIKGQQDNGEQHSAFNGEHRGQPKDVGMAIFSEKAKAALEFFGDTASIHQQNGKVYFNMNDNPEVFSTWEDFAAWLEKFADDMASNGYPLM